MSSRLLNIHNFVADKLTWQLQVLLDGSLSANARMVGCLIAHDLNVERGAAWRAQENMALALGVHRDTVRRGIAELARAGFLAVRRSCGRGRSQHYSALIRDAAEAHDSIERAVQARRAAVNPTPEKVAELQSDTSEKVAGLQLDASEKVAGLRLNEPEKVAGLRVKGSRAATQYLEEPFNPPLPPRATNRVRDYGPEQKPVRAAFKDLSVRRAVASRLGEEGVRSWLDPHGWDGESRTIVCRFDVAARKLSADCRQELKALGVTVVFDKMRFAAVERAGRPVVVQADQAA